MPWRGIRLRVVAVALAVIAGTLVLASIFLVAALRQSLLDDLRLAARSRADAIARSLGAAGGYELQGNDDRFEQILNAEGELIASDPVAAEPYADLAAGDEATVVVPFDDDEFLAVGTGASTPDGPVTVVVGLPIEGATDSTATVTGLLMIGVPLLLITVGLVLWRAVGRALAPVEAIRREVSAISVADLHRRVPEPGSDDEISRLAATMNAMLDRLEKEIAVRHRFVSDASHELRSPIASIRQQVEVAIAHPQGVDLTDLAQCVLQEDLRLQRLVDDLLTLARLDESALVTGRAQVDLDDLVLEELGRPANGVEIDGTAVSGGRVIGDRRQLQSLIRNLIDNAIRHAESKVSVSLETSGDEVVFAVDDDGSGVETADRERIFERFVRLDEHRSRSAGGTGLGLAIVAEVARSHGGSVSVDDSPLGGARFQVRLPAVEE